MRISVVSLVVALTTMLGCASAPQLTVHIKGEYIQSALRPPKDLDSHIDIYPSGTQPADATTIGSVILNFSDRACHRDEPALRAWVLEKARQMGGDAIVDLNIDHCSGFSTSSSGIAIPGNYITTAYSSSSTTEWRGLISMTAKVIATSPIRKQFQNPTHRLIGIWDLLDEERKPRNVSIEFSQQLGMHILGRAISNDHRSECAISGRVDTNGAVILSYLECNHGMAITDYLLKIIDSDHMEGELIRFKVPNDKDTPYRKKRYLIRRVVAQ